MRQTRHPPRFFTLGELASLTGLTREAIRLQVRQGNIGFYTHGRSIRIPLSEIGRVKEIYQDMDWPYDTPIPESSDPFKAAVNT